MSTRTDFLDLILPELNEFINTWNAPVNQNMESIDDFCSDLYESLVGSSATSTWAALRGSLASLSLRLDVSINADGTIDLSASPDLLAIATSAYHGQFSTPVNRLNDTDDRIYDSSQPAVGGRFVPIPATGPTAGFPHESLDSGIAIRAMDFGVSGAQPISSPQRPWAPGLVTGGGGTFITGVSESKVQLNGLAAPAVFNIDGYVFRLREDILLDYALLSPIANQYVWIFVDRVEGNYNNANFRYGTAVLAKDLRRLQSGSGTGQTSGSVFQATGSLFNTALIGRVKSGDVLIIDSGAAAGEYVIDALDGVTPDTKLTIKGTFKANLSGLTWHIKDNWHPNIGAVITGTDATVRPTFVAGRVYIGRVKHQVAAAPIEVVTFTPGGVYDSGWIVPTFPQTLPHNLGAFPSFVDVWVRENSSSRAYRPLVRRQVLTNFDTVNAVVDPGDPKTATLLFPSMYLHTSDLTVIADLLNASTDPLKPVAFFTDSAGVDKVAGEMRIVARR
jgi:hypothetical protein